MDRLITYLVEVDLVGWKVSNCTEDVVALLKKRWELNCPSPMTWVLVSKKGRARRRKSGRNGR